MRRRQRRALALHLLAGFDRHRLDHGRIEPGVTGECLHPTRQCAGQRQLDAVGLLPSTGMVCWVAGSTALM